MNEQHCIHHWLTGYLVTEVDPEFWSKYPSLEAGSEYEICKNCGIVQINRMHVPSTIWPKGEIISQPRSRSMGNHRPPPPPEYLTVTQVANRLNIKENSVRIYIRTHILRGKQITEGEKHYWMVEISSVIEHEKRAKEKKANELSKREFT